MVRMRNARAGSRPARYTTAAALATALLLASCGGSSPSADRDHSEESSSSTISAARANDTPTSSGPAKAVEPPAPTTAGGPQPAVPTAPGPSAPSGPFDMCLVAPLTDVGRISGRPIGRSVPRVDTTANLTAYNCTYLNERGDTQLTVGLNPYASYSSLIERPGAMAVAGVGDEATWFGYGIGAAVKRKGAFIQVVDGNTLVGGVSSIPEAKFIEIVRLVESRLPDRLPELERALGRGIEVSIRAPAHSINDKIALLYDRADGGRMIAKCGLVDGAGTAIPGLSSVAIVAAGPTKSGAIEYIELATLDPAQVPGIVKGTGTVRGPGATSPLSGLLTFNSDRVSGSFDMTDSAGAPVTGTFNCAARL